MKWYLRITTKKGVVIFPYNGYKTKREAITQKKLAEQDKQVVSVEIVKEV